MPEYNYPGYGPTGQSWLTSRPGTEGGYHGGNDNPAPAHTPVYAEHTGKVFRSGDIQGYGLAVVVESVAPNGKKFYELYGHLAPGSLPTPGTSITAGQPVPGALIGTKKDVTDRGGLSTGPHLHREIISGNAPLNKEGGFGIFSSDIKFKANPDTFDISNPVFPYENGEIKPAPESAPPSPHFPTGPSRPNTMLPGSNPPARAPLQLSPGMPVLGADGPSSLGGPNGPTPLVPAKPALSPINFVPPPSSGGLPQLSPNDTPSAHGNTPPITAPWPAGAGVPRPPQAPPAASWPSSPVAPLRLMRQAEPEYRHWHDAGDSPQQGPPTSVQTKPPTENSLSAFPNGVRDAVDAQPLAPQRLAPPSPLPVENLTTRTLRMKGVPEADIAAAISNPATMQDILNQYYGRRSITPGNDSRAAYNRAMQGSPAAQPDQASMPAAATPENYIPFGWAGLPALLR
jgi:murein DD-endopeptidase MepM/ murein hydrolase activator NlpD